MTRYRIMQNAENEKFYIQEKSWFLWMSHGTSDKYNFYRTEYLLFEDADAVVEDLIKPKHSTKDRKDEIIKEF